MWEREWASPPPPLEHAPAGFRSQVEPGDVEGAYLLTWMEHCVECAVPDCYSVCPLYVARRDRKCARFRYGIAPNPDFRGLYDFGADVWFRRWGKLEAVLDGGFAPLADHRTLAERDRRTLQILDPVARALEPLDRMRRLNGAYRILRSWSGRAGDDEAGFRFDELVIEVWNPQDRPVELAIEIHQDRLRFRRGLTLAPGANLHRIPAGELGLDPSRRHGRILVLPADDAEVRLVFTWLDFVRWKRAAVPAAPPAPRPAASRAPAAKVKVVAWDLDRTLWNGILVEDGADSLVTNAEAVATIRRLDERGILHVVASKNDHAAAWPVLERLGLADWFVAGAINWGPKSENLRQLAAELNLGLDAFAFVDDSAFERGEVESELPEVRTYPDTGIAALPDRPEFDVAVSEESRDRRRSYQAEGRRREIAQRFGDRYDDFLASCAMRLDLFRPDGEAARTRCLELLQRSNQLNLSTRRYDTAEFAALLADPGVTSLALRCRDRYGDYGTVGFVAIESPAGGTPRVRDLVMSCRVAQKKVEHALFESLRGSLASAGATNLLATFLPTARNGILLAALRDVGFAVRDERDDAVEVELDLSRPVPGGTIVTVETGASAPASALTPARADEG